MAERGESVAIGSVALKVFDHFESRRRKESPRGVRKPCVGKSQNL